MIGYVIYVSCSVGTTRREDTGAEPSSICSDRTIAVDLTVHPRYCFVNVCASSHCVHL